MASKKRFARSRIKSLIYYECLPKQPKVENVTMDYPFKPRLPNTRLNPADQSGAGIPNVFVRLAQSSREFDGRAAGVGYSEAGMPVTVTVRPAPLKIALAKSAQETGGWPAKWYVPDLDGAI